MGPFGARLRKENAAATFPMLGIFRHQKAYWFSPQMSSKLYKKIKSPHFSNFRRGGDVKIDCVRTFIWPTSWMLGINPNGRFLNANLNSSAYKKGLDHLFIIVLTISTRTFLCKSNSSFLNFWNWSGDF